MGDYTKLIVNCSIKKTEDTEALREEILEKLGFLGSSAYHCGGEFLHIENDWHHRTDISIISQQKYGRNIDEFLDWLRPQIVDGFGSNDTWAIVADEYSEPYFIKLDRGDL